MNNLVNNLVSVILAVAEFATKWHGSQKRKDGVTPYMVHPIGVARITAELGGDEAAIKAALLHDVLEDTPCTPSIMENAWGEEVLSIVRELSDDKSLPKKERKELTIKHAPSLFLSASIVKLADCTYNLRSLYDAPPNWTKERIQEYISWLTRVVDALDLSPERKEVFYSSIQ